MKIKVEYNNFLLGKAIFWLGDSKDINQIKNIPARRLAEVVAKKGGTRKIGMWIVSEEKTNEN